MPDLIAHPRRSRMHSVSARGRTRQAPRTKSGPEVPRLVPSGPPHQASLTGAKQPPSRSPRTNRRKALSHKCSDAVGIGTLLDRIPDHPPCQ